ncbi:MAG: hypothetical protein AAFR81_09030 [Chloroflexota bacterium]
MSVIYTVLPFEESKRAELKAWLGDVYKASASQGTEPTFAELQSAISQAVDELGFTVEYLESDTQWEASIHHNNSAFSSFEVTMPTRNAKFVFSGDVSVLEAVLQQLPTHCGTFMILANGEPHVLVTAQGN